MSDDPRIDLAEVQRLTDGATPGPWTRVHPHSNFLRCPSCDQGEYVAKSIDSMYGEPHHMDEDTEFIAAARSLVPALAVEVEFLRSQVATARADALNEAADEVEAKLAALPAHAQGGDYARDERLFVLRLRARAVGAE